MLARRSSLVFTVVFVGALSAVMLAAPTATTTSLVFSLNPVIVGSPSPTLTATTVETGTATLVTGGKLRIQRMVDDFSSLPVACGTPNSHGEVFDEEDPTDGTFDNTTADTSVIGSFGYFAQYVPSGGSGFH
jgi:hypothetical protein